MTKNINETNGKFKPDCRLIGENGNIYNLVGIASRTLRSCDMAKEAKEMQDRVFSSHNYEEALGIIDEYVNVTGPEYDEDDDFCMR